MAGFSFVSVRQPFAPERDPSLRASLWRRDRVVVEISYEARSSDYAGHALCK